MTQFSLHDQAGPLGRSPIFHALQRKGSMSPDDIAGMNRDSLLDISPPREIGKILPPWQAAWVPRGEHFPRSPQLQLMAATAELIQATRPPNLEATVLRKIALSRNAQWA